MQTRGLADDCKTKHDGSGASLGLTKVHDVASRFGPCHSDLPLQISSNCCSV